MSKKLLELQQKQHDLKTEATALLDKADAEGRELSETEESRWTEIETELATISRAIAGEQDKAERRRSLDVIRTAPPAQAQPQPQRNVRAEVFDPNPATTGGFRSLAEMAVAVRNACTPGGMVDPRLVALNGGRVVQGGGTMAAPTGYMEGSGSSGEGYMLPVQYREDIWQLVTELQDIFTTVDLEPTMARQVDWTADETTPWGATGVQAYWRAEAAQMTASKAATKGRSMTLHELYAFVLATEELLEDAPRLQARLSFKAAQAINWKINDAVVNGAGAGKPLGWLNADCLVTVSKESGQTATTIVAANVLKMFSRLLVAPGDQPYWLANRDTVPQLAAMTIGDQPVWMPPNGLISAPGGILLGFPVRFSEHGKTLGTVGDLHLVSPKGYYAARRTDGPQFASSMHLYFDYNIQAFRWTFRFGGQPHLSAAVSPANGSNTKSHFVVLQTRS